MPALLTSTCRAPCSLTIASIAASTRGAVVDVRARRRGSRRCAASASPIACGAGVGGRGADRPSSPAPASASAIARPMPRDAPVTSATWPANRDVAHASSPFASAQRRRVEHRRRRRASASMRLTMPASTLPGPHSTMCVDAARAHAPAPSRPSAPGRRPGGTARRGSPPARSATATSMLLITGMRGAAKRRRRRAARAAARPPASSGSNGTAPTPAAAARAWRPRPSAARRPASTPALVPAITVCFGSLKLAASTDLAGLAAATSAQPSRTACGVEAEDRRHRAGADRHRLLHRLRAKAHQRQRVGQASARRRRPARVYSPSEWPATTAGSRAALGEPGAIAGDARGQHHRLGVGRQVELLLRAFADQARRCPRRARRRPRRSVCAHGRVVAPGVEHADGLRALAGKDECERHASRSMPCRAQKSSSTAPQVKPPPTPSSITVSPRLIVPSRTASSSASGIDAADVLPCSSTVTISLSSGSFSFLRRALHDADVGLVRDQPVDVGLAAAGLREHRARDALEHADGELEHRLAVHLQQRIAEHLAAGDRARARTGCRRGGRRRAARWPGCPASSLASSTTAPAPSPNSTQVVRSLKSRMRENTSAPIDQRLARGAGADHRVGDRQRVDEARAHRLHVERGAAVRRRACAARCRRPTGTPCRASRWRR